MLNAYLDGLKLPWKVKKFKIKHFLVWEDENDRCSSHLMVLTLDNHEKLRLLIRSYREIGDDLIINTDKFKAIPLSFTAIYINPKFARISHNQALLKKVLEEYRKENE